MTGTRIAGLDVGDKTIGVAISDPLGWTAQGLEVIRRRRIADDLGRLRHVFRQYEVTLCVVGLPRNMNGTYGPRADRARAFAREVEALGVEVVTWDERLTTRRAEQTLIEGGVSRAKREQVVDKMAATFILQSYLDFRARQGGPSSGV